MIADFAKPLPVMVMCDWMRLPPDLHEVVERWTHDIRSLLEPGLLKAPDMVHACGVVDSFVRELRAVMDERRAAPGDDLISALLAARTAGGDRLSDEEVAFVCIMCFVAGNETTAALIGNAVLALLQHPAQGELLRRRPELAPSAVQEALRYDSPLQVTKRLVIDQVQIDDVMLREGDQVLLCLAAANRDPAVFADPDAFDITRSANGHVAFGHGMHGCLGGTLATVQAEVALAELFGRSGRLAATPARLQWQSHSAIVRALESLPVVVGSSP